jgi:hypothetical protein
MSFERLSIVISTHAAQFDAVAFKDFEAIWPRSQDGATRVWSWQSVTLIRSMWIGLKKSCQVWD